MSMATNNNIEHQRSWFGSRMIEAGFISEQQRDNILSIQHNLKLNGKWLKFGEIAVSEGFCSDNDLGKLPGLLGHRMLEAGMITLDQQNDLAELQNRLHKKGFNVLFGDLSVSEGICSKNDIQNLLDESKAS